LNLRLLALTALIACTAGPAPVVRAGVTHSLPPDSVYHVEASLAAASGQALEWRALRGKPRVVAMFYASCRAVCPMIVESARAVQRSLSEAERGRVGFVLISMDPRRDNPAALAKLQTERHLDPASWLLLQPGERDVRALAAVLGVRYRELADGEFNHTTTLVLLDAEGRVLARTENVGAAGDKAFSDAVRAAATGRQAP
jgi:protein SCO1/2